MVEEVLADCGAQANLHHLMRKIQAKLELSKLLGAYLFYSPDAVVNHSEQEWADIRSRLAVFKLIRNVFLSRAHKDNHGQWQVNTF